MSAPELASVEQVPLGKHLFSSAWESRIRWLRRLHQCVWQL